MTARRWLRALRGARRDDGGSVLVAALVVSFLVLTGVAVALTTASTSIEQSSAYGTTTAARLAAESGIQATLVGMQNASAVGDLPCSSSDSRSVGTASAYTATVTYDPGGACPASDTTKATITAAGTSGAQRVTMQAVVSISNQPPTQPGYHYAVNAGQGDASLHGSYEDGAQTPNGIYAQQQVSCSNDGWIYGDVHSDGGVSGCQVQGATSQPSVNPFPSLSESQLTSSSDWPGDDFVTVPSSVCDASDPSGTSAYGNAAAAWLADEASHASVTTVVDATGCSSGLTITGASTTSGTCSTYRVAANVIVLASSVSVSGCNDFGASSGSHSLSIVGLSSSGAVNVGGTNRFDWSPSTSQTSGSSLNVLVYSPGQVHFSCGGHVSGQILGGQGVSTGGGFTLTGSDDGADPIPQAHQPSGITVTLASEVLLSD